MIQKAVKMEYGTKATEVINLRSFSKLMNAFDTPDEGEGRDGVIKEPHFQPLPSASV